MKSSNAQLVLLSGAYEYDDILSALDPEDENLIISGIYDFDLDYLKNKYPEYMGFWRQLAKRGAKLGKRLFRRIGKKRRAKRAAKKRRVTKARQERALSAALQRQEQIEDYQFAMQKKHQEANTKNMILIGGGSLAALLLFLKARKG